MPRNEKDPSVPEDRSMLRDLTDPYLIDLYRRRGLLEADDFTTFDAEQVRLMVTEAFWTGAQVLEKSPEELRATSEEINRHLGLTAT